MKINKNLVVVIILVLLVLVSAIQAFQLKDIKKDLSEMDLTKPSKVVSQTSTSTSNSEGGSAAIPTNLQNLPGMVGGC